MVSIGASGGASDPIAVASLNAKGSLFLTRPGLVGHATDLAEYHARADAVLSAVTPMIGVVPLAIGTGCRQIIAATRAGVVTMNFQSTSAARRWGAACSS